MIKGSPTEDQQVISYKPHNYDTQYILNPYDLAEDGWNTMAITFTGDSYAYDIVLKTTHDTSGGGESGDFGFVDAPD